MKRVIRVDFLSVILGIVLTVAAVVLFDWYLAREVEQVGAPARVQRATLMVEDMACPGCPERVKRGIKRLNGIQSVDIDHDRGVIVVDYVRGETSILAIVDRVQSVGFQTSVPKASGKIEVLDFKIKFQ